MQKQKRGELVEEKSELDLEIHGRQEDIEMLHIKMESQKDNTKKEIKKLLKEIELNKGHANEYQMGFEDTLTHRAILAERFRKLQRQYDIAQAELRYLSKAYVSYLV